MPNTYFQFKQFRIEQAQSGMKVTTDGCLFGAWVADWIKQQAFEPRRILDIGTGTGLLSLMLAQVTSNTEIDAIEINESAYDEASANFSASPWFDRFNISHRSIQDFKNEQPYDLIICNPPFFKDNLKGNQTNKNQAVHSDTLSIEELVAGIDQLLDNDGIAFVMYPQWESGKFTKQMERLGFHQQHQLTVSHQKDAQPLRVIASYQKQATTLNETSLIIRETDGSYSHDFSRLLHSYYL